MISLLVLIVLIVVIALLFLALIKYHLQTNLFRIFTVFAIISFLMSFIINYNVFGTGELIREVLFGAQPTEWQEVVNKIGLPELPLLPRSSASEPYRPFYLDTYCKRTSPVCGTLWSISADIIGAIRDAGFPEVAIFFGYRDFFDVSPKVIIVTPAERIFSSGEPASLGRFNDARPQALRDYSWLEFIRLLLYGREGRVRFFVVEIGGDEYIPFSSRRVSYYDIREQFKTGAVRLPAILENFPVNSMTHVTFHVYEYNALRDQEPLQIQSGDGPARHLALAGIQIPGLTSE